MLLTACRQFGPRPCAPTPVLMRKVSACLYQEMVLAANRRLDAEKLERILAGETEASSAEEIQVAALAQRLRALGETERGPSPFFSAMEQRLLAEPSDELQPARPRLQPRRAAKALDAALSGAPAHHRHRQLVALAGRLSPLPAPQMSTQFVDRLEARLLREPPSGPAQRRSISTNLLGGGLRLRPAQALAAAVVAFAVAFLGSQLRLDRPTTRGASAATRQAGTGNEGLIPRVAPPESPTAVARAIAFLTSTPNRGLFSQGGGGAAAGGGGHAPPPQGTTESGASATAERASYGAGAMLRELLTGGRP